MTNELNPNHGVVAELREQWYKMCAIIMFKQGLTRVVITNDDIERFVNSGYANIVAHPHGNVITITLVTDKEAARLARKEGGLPV